TCNFHLRRRCPLWVKSYISQCNRNVRFGSKADMCSAHAHVRFTPESDIKCDIWECPLWAKSGHSRHHSISSSARERSEGGMVSPSVFAVLRLIASSYFVGACTGMSDGFSPLRMRSM